MKRVEENKRESKRMCEREREERERERERRESVKEHKK